MVNRPGAPLPTHIALRQLYLTARHHVLCPDRASAAQTALNTARGAAFWSVTVTWSSAAWGCYENNVNKPWLEEGLHHHTTLPYVHRIQLPDTEECSALLILSNSKSVHHT